MSAEMKEPDDSEEVNDEQAESRERNQISEGSANLLSQPIDSNEAQREAATPDQSSVRGGTDPENDKPQNPIPVGNGASNPVGDSNDSSDPFSPDYRSSPLERVIDAKALQSYDESLAAGPGRYRYIEQDPSPLIDLIRVSETNQIHVSLFEFVKSGASLVHGPEITYEGRKHQVPVLPQVVASSLLLPHWTADYGTTRELFNTIQGLLKEHLALPERQCALLTYWCITTWFPDFLAFIPRLTITGSSFAADHLFRVLRSICRRPLLLAGVNTAVFKAIAVEQLMPTIFVRETRLSKKNIELLDASDQQGYLVTCGKDLCDFYCAKCIYVGEYNDALSVPTGIHIHTTARKPTSAATVPAYIDFKLLQAQLFRYRAFNHDLVRFSDFKANGLSPELSAAAQQLGSAIVEDECLQDELLELLTEQDGQVRVDRSTAVNAIVLRAVLDHCHDGEQQKVFVRDLAMTVNNTYRDEGEALKITNERLGHILKNLGLYTHRLGSAGRGLVLDNATRIRAHELSYANEVLPETPGCGHCQRLLVQQS